MVCSRLMAEEYDGRFTRNTIVEFFYENVREKAKEHAGVSTMGEAESGGRVTTMGGDGGEYTRGRCQEINF